MSLLHWASDIGIKNIVHLLLEKGVSINAQDDEGQTALHYGIFFLIRKLYYDFALISVQYI